MAVTDINQRTAMPPAYSADASDATPLTLIDELLAEQHALTAVERFSQRHEQQQLPVQARYYRDLIPLTTPQPGQQYAFEVDLDRCTGCKACVSACHSLNGLDEDETWRSVGLLQDSTFKQPVQQIITTACHHCVDPGCLNGCPVLAYEKDPVTGVVAHLDDQCIGCQYCILKCPYDAPKYSAQRGIVRKCDMCSSRLAVGEAPACVQACPNEAIRITLVDQQEMTLAFRATTADTNTFLPGSPSPEYTIPATLYKSAKALPDNLRPSEVKNVTPQPAHTPLGFMLVFSQLAVGTAVADAVVAPWLETSSRQGIRFTQSLTVLLVTVAALGIGVLHLGRPLQAWRSFLGWHKSWLSRELIAFGLFFNLAAVSVFMRTAQVPAANSAALDFAVASLGLLGVFCSAMIYADTQRDFWRLPLAGGKFLGTTLLLGAATTLLLASVLADLGLKTPLIAALILAALLKISLESRVLRRLADDDYSPLHKTALLLTGKLGVLHRLQLLCTWLGGVALPMLILLLVPTLPSSRSLTLLTSLTLALCLAGELFERRLFFVAVQPVKMPGTSAA